MFTATAGIVGTQKLGQRLLSSSNLFPPSIKPYLLQLQAQSGADFSRFITIADNLLTFMQGREHQSVKKVLSEVLSVTELVQFDADIRGVVEQVIGSLTPRLNCNNSTNKSELTPAVDIVKDIENPLFIGIVERVFGLQVDDHETLVCDTNNALRIAEPMQSVKKLLAIQDIFVRLIAQIETQIKTQIGAQFYAAKTCEASVKKASTTLSGTGASKGLIDRISERLSASSLLQTSASIATVIATLIVASRTTSETLSNIIVNNSLLNAAQREHFQCESWVREHIQSMVRFCASTEYLTRTAAADITIEQCAFKANDSAFVHIPSVNRDTSYYENCEYARLAEFAPKRHLSFGAGVHRCPGEHLALMTLVIAIPALYSAFPQLIVETSRIVYQPSKMVKRIASAPVELEV